MLPKGKTENCYKIVKATQTENIAVFIELSSDFTFTALCYCKSSNFSGLAPASQWQQTSPSQTSTNIWIKAYVYSCWQDKITFFLR